MNSYSRLLYFVKPYYKRMLFAVFCMIVAAAAYLVVPWLIKNVGHIIGLTIGCKTTN